MEGLAQFTTKELLEELFSRHKAGVWLSIREADSVDGKKKEEFYATYEGGLTYATGLVRRAETNLELFHLQLLEDNDDDE